MQASTRQNLVALVAVITVAAALRFFGLNWDQGHALHPDERFLVMVANDSKLPESFGEYLDPNRSPLVPYNTKYGFFVYGTLPTTVLKLVAQPFDTDHFGGLLQTGRALSAVADIGTVVLVWLLAWVLCRKERDLPPFLPSVSALLYATTVFPIQQAHFFTVDSFANFFSIAALTCAVLASNGGIRWVVAAAVMTGAAIGCKLSALLILPLIGVLCVLTAAKNACAGSIKPALRSFAVRGLTFGAIAYLSLRVCDPKFFADANFLVPLINPKFLANIRELKNLTSYSEWPFPPSLQWLSKTPFVFPLTNLIVYGLGLPLAALCVVGFVQLLRKRDVVISMILVWGLSFFLYQASAFVHSMRYFLVLYPMLALAAGYGLLVMLAKVQDRGFRSCLIGGITVALAFWPICFLRIYSEPHSRRTASEWIYRNIPAGSVLAQEHWDDSLPLGIPGEDNRYETIQMPVFAPDNDDKWKEIDAALARADYVIFTSNRGYGSLMPLGEKFPRINAWYRSLFNGTAEFEKIAEFSSLPGLKVGPLKIEIDTQKAEEAFSVYDHPKVTIFKRKCQTSPIS